MYYTNKMNNNTEKYRVVTLGCGIEERPGGTKRRKKRCEMLQLVIF